MNIILFGDTVRENAQLAADEIIAIENGEFVTFQASSFGDGSRARLPEARGANRQNHLRRSRAQGGDSLSRIVNFHYDEYDDIRQMFRDNRSAQTAHGNEHGNHSSLDTMYEVVITPNFNIVMEITTIRIGW